MAVGGGGRQLETAERQLDGAGQRLGGGQAAGIFPIKKPGQWGEEIFNSGHRAVREFGIFWMTLRGSERICTTLTDFERI